MTKSDLKEVFGLSKEEVEANLAMTGLCKSQAANEKLRGLEAIINSTSYSILSIEVQEKLNAKYLELVMEELKWTY